MTRIIGGQGKGRRLTAPRGDRTRPTGARLRQSLFDILAPRLPGCRFLDLCAGSGAVGLEALSRGAAHVTLVDEDAAAVASIRANAAVLQGAGGETRVLRQEARAALAGLRASGDRFDVIFVDPPYDSPQYEVVIEAADAVMAEGGVVVAEHFHKRDLPETIGRLSRTRGARIGDHRLSFYQRAPE
ncbi:MAG TPA: 16S rRNA (guanine(966)-N(2))-methyltransferase RsmD [Vicinamibacteria bacterium]|jgi:16S rRNA (guanine(966)-N(2))-methyltransferase RsmD